MEKKKMKLTQMSSELEKNLRPDIVLALVQPVGTPLDSVRKKIEEAVIRIGAKYEHINLTKLIESVVEESERKLSEKIGPASLGLSAVPSEKEGVVEESGILHSGKVGSTPAETSDISFDTSSIVDKIVKKQKSITASKGYLNLSLKMHAGTAAREQSGADVFAVYGTAVINARRDSNKTLKRIFVLDSLKNQAEVAAFRRLYGDAFFLLAVSSSHDEKVKFLTKSRGMEEYEAQELISRDEKEESSIKFYGQSVSKTFEQADFFATPKTPQLEFNRFIELLFGNPMIAPYPHEQFMHIAFSTATLSSDLGRQVGAVIVSKTGEVLSIGRNEVPKAGGGVYAEGDKPDGRDKTLGRDPNTQRINQLEKEIGSMPDHTKAQIKSLIEYHRTVHAEMEALLSCTRKGLSVLSSTIYTTTFPCHNCAKHIIGSGIRRVVYLEAYQKSLAFDLHSEAIIASENAASNEGPIVISRFEGVGPRRYFDLFSQSLATVAIQDKKYDDGLITIFNASESKARYSVSDKFATEGEAIAIQTLMSLDWYVKAGQNINDLLKAA